MAARRRTENITLAVAFAIAAAWRGWGLWHRGLLEHDEGHALLNANTWWHALRWVLTGGPWAKDPANSISALRDTLHQQGGTLYSAGKLGYSLLVALAGLPGHVSTGLALVLAWVAGLLVALLCGVVAWQYTRMRAAAVIAAGGCLASPLESALAREASGTIWALVFGLAALALMQRSMALERRGQRWALGLTAGGLLAYGFTCHFNIAPFILAAYLAAGLYVTRDSRGFGRRVRQGFMAVLPAAIGGLAGLLIAELATRVADFALRRAYPDFLPLSGELYQLFFLLKWPVIDGQLYGDGAVGWSAKAWAIYGRAFVWEGPVWLTLMPVSAWLAWRARKPGTRHRGVAPAIALIAIPCLFYAAYSYRVERVLGMILAPSWIFIAAVLAPPLQRLMTSELDTRGKILHGTVVLLMLAQFAWAALVWGIYAQLRSPVPVLVRKTFDAPPAAGKRITAGSFDIGFAPLWKWAIVEEDRRHSGGRDSGPIVDFSRFDGTQIVFVDQFTWRRPNDDFKITRLQVAQGREIARATSMAPAAVVRSVLLADAETTSTTGLQP